MKLADVVQYPRTIQTTTVTKVRRADMMSPSNMTVGRQDNNPTSHTISSNTHHHQSRTNLDDMLFTLSYDQQLEQKHLTRLDLANKGLKRIEKLPNIHFQIIDFDNNEINKIENLENCQMLIQLSLFHNRLVDIRSLSRLRLLEKLNLAQNSIDSIESLKSLQNLVSLNISCNNISSLSALNSCHLLQYLDASDNTIREIEDLSALTSLRYLNLNKNFIDTLVHVPRNLPKKIQTLIISDNEIQDLTEICYLSTLIELQTLWIMQNPCVEIESRQGYRQRFDYRPYIFNYLPLRNLDGYTISRKESLKAEWLLTQGKGRTFRPGEHLELVEYLSKVCSIESTEKDEQHLSRIMHLQDMYTQQKRNSESISNIDDEKNFGSDTMTAADTLPKDSQLKQTPITQQSLLLSESEYIKISPSPSSSVSSTNDMHTLVGGTRQLRTPSPLVMSRSINNPLNASIEDSTSRTNNRYVEYDARPVKPLDQNLFQTKLNEYAVVNTNDETRLRQEPMRNRSKSTATTNSSQLSNQPHLAYNANRYSPKTASHGPTTSSALQHTTTATTLRLKQKNTTDKYRNKNKRHTIAAATVIIDNDDNKHVRCRTSPKIIQENKKLITSQHPHHNVKDKPLSNRSIRSKPRVNGTGLKPLVAEHTDDEDEEFHPKTEPIINTLRTSHASPTLLTTKTRLQSNDAQMTTTTTVETNDFKMLTTSVETMRTAMLQAYLNLHERFTKTTELQTSAMAALWKMVENNNRMKQSQTDKVLEENRLLNQRVLDLEAKLNKTNTNGNNSVDEQGHPSSPRSTSARLSFDTISAHQSTPVKNQNAVLSNKTDSSLLPPLRAHISKRDAKSFFLHWVPNPNNRQILGYKIYIDDTLKGVVEPTKFEVIINDIRDEGEYRIKIRAYDEHFESSDSNIVIARFRRQQKNTSSTIASTQASTPLQRTQSDHQIKDKISSAVKTEDNTVDRYHPLRQTQSYGNLFPSSSQTPIIMDQQKKNTTEGELSMCSGGFPTHQQQQFRSYSFDNGIPQEEEQSIKKSFSPDNVIDQSPVNYTFGTPERKCSNEDLHSSAMSSPSQSNRNNDNNNNIILRKPPRSPNRDKDSGSTSTHTGTCSKVLFSSESTSTSKHSPNRSSGIMSRLAKSPLKVKRSQIQQQQQPHSRNALLNALIADQQQTTTTSELHRPSSSNFVVEYSRSYHKPQSISPEELKNKSKTKILNRITNFIPITNPLNLSCNVIYRQLECSHLLAQYYPMSSDTTMKFSMSSPLPIPPRQSTRHKSSRTYNTAEEEMTEM